jgi:hypothetical protein
MPPAAPATRTFGVEAQDMAFVVAADRNVGRHQRIDRQGHHLKPNRILGPGFDLALSKKKDHNRY